MGGLGAPRSVPNVNWCVENFPLDIPLPDISPLTQTMNLTLTLTLTEQGRGNVLGGIVQGNCPFPVNGRRMLSSTAVFYVTTTLLRVKNCSLTRAVSVNYRPSVAR